MFSYLHSIRPSNRRTALSPNPTPQQAASLRHYHEGPLNLAETSYGTLSYRALNEGGLPSPSPVSPNPPILPPIPRVASHNEPQRQEDTSHQNFDPRIAHREGQQRASEWPTIPQPKSPPIDTLPRPSYVSSQSHQHQNKPYHSTNAFYDPIQPKPRPSSTGNSSYVPPPIRPPPPPPISSPQLEPSATNNTRHGRTKLNLLNPITLLARRRSSQVLSDSPDKHLPTKHSGRLGISLPDDYDPRIRGQGIHDFSAPRTGRVHSSHDANLSTQERGKNQGSQSLNPYRLSPNPNSPSPQEEDSPNSTEREHTPIFKEHFDDDIGLVSDMHGGTSKHRTSTFMYQISLTESHPDPDPSSIPAFARGLPSRVSTVAEKESPHFSSPNLPLEVVHETNLIEGASTEVSPKPSPPISPPPVRSRASSNTDSPFQPAGLPKHFKSNASRFSFDLAGVGSSAQEKLLEEKHRQKAKREACISDTLKLPHDEDFSHGVEDEDGYSDYDNMDDDGGLEERVPGVNADTEDAIAPVLPKDIESFHLLSPAASSFMSPSSPEINLPGTPRDDQGQPIGFAVSNSSLNLQQSSPDKSVYATGNHSATGLGLRYEMIGSMEDHAHPLMNKTFYNLQSKPPLAGLPTRQQDDHEDDLYFDDGMIEDFDGNDIQAFDESVFDDDTSRVYGLPLRDLRLIGQDRKDTDCLQDKLSSSQKEQERNDPLLSDNYDKSMSTERSKTSQQIPDPSPKYGSRTTYSNAAGLTQDNLAAYHNALAFAANQAALNGEFNRRQSVDSRGRDGTPDDLPGMTPDDGRGSQEINDQNFSPAVDDAEAFDFDDDLTDDPIIAAANAEVLENDDDGFYGQEFGFFARATGSGEYSNGGYFGNRGVEGLGRSHSGRANFQEPSLTPITERSEWSNRNSAISLAMQGYPQSAQHALPSPGLAQLADMLQLEEDNMSLSALMKLRRGAWGSSSTSLQSSSGSQISGSPLNILPVIPATTVASTTSSVQAHNFTSTNSLASSTGPNSGSDSDIAPSSPTVTLSSGNILSTVKPSRSESSPDLSLPVQKLFDPAAVPSRPRSSQLIGKVAGHSRNSSGAESVSYMHENDGDGNGGRWVVEKRRVGENGMMEILGREVLEGGRI